MIVDFQAFQAGSIQSSQMMSFFKPILGYPSSEKNAMCVREGSNPTLASV